MTDWVRARDTFVAVLDDGYSEVRVARGDVLPADHQLVQRDLNRGKGEPPLLFEPLEAPPPEKPARARKTTAAAGNGAT